MRLFVLLAFLLASSISSSQEELQFEWVKTIGSATGNESGKHIVLDTTENMYINGRYYGTVDFDQGPAVFEMTSEYGQLEYLLKLDDEGNFVWAKTIGTQSLYVWGIAIDAFANIYITGYYNGTMDFDPSDDVFNMTAVSEDAFVLKLDTYGNFVWAKTIGGSLTDNGYSITTDSNDDIYIVGEYFGTIDLNPNSGTSSFTSNGESDIFILKLSNNGDFAWGKSIGGIENDVCTAVTTDINGNAYFTGLYETIVDFDSSTDDYYMTAYANNKDVFILKLDSNGDFVWAKSIVDNMDVGVSSTTVDYYGNLYLTGYFFIADFDPGPEVYELNASNGSAADAFILKLDLNGNFLWAKSFGGDSNDRAKSVLSDNEGNVYIGGIFQSTAIDFDPDSASYIINNYSSLNGFVLKLDSSGVFNWAYSIGSTSPAAIFSIVLDSSNNIIATGGFSGSVDFNPHIFQVNEAQSNGFFDAFVQKVSQSTITNINEFESTWSAKIFPNPNHGLINIQMTNYDGFSFNVLDIRGQLIFKSEKIYDSNYRFSYDGDPGLYIFEIITGNSKKYYKVIKE